MAITRLMTAEALAALPADGYQYDLIDGELRRMFPPGAEHGEIAFELSRRIGNYVVERGRGRVYAAKTGFLLRRDPDTVLAPDLAFVQAERLPPRAERRGYLPLAPDLVVEVASPSDRPAEIQQKVGCYLDAGIRLVWIADPSACTVAVYRPGHPPLVLHQDDTLDGADVLPDLQIPVTDLFQ
ncbi:MAG: Uma2 family endonuclease [Chloroflexota bacterium]|nr:Uma2 family endonuclease [Chloroflexota bacterium]